MASAATAFLAGLLLARAPASRFGVVGLAARCLAVSLVAIAASAICLIVPRFLLVFGAAAWTNGLRSAAHNLDVTLVMVVMLGTCLSLIKTTLLLRSQPGNVWIAADLAATIILAVALAVLDRVIWQIRTGLVASGGLAGFLDDQRLRAAMLCLPLAASGWVWASAALVHQPERWRRLLMSSIAAAAAGLWGGLFVPF